MEQQLDDSHGVRPRPAGLVAASVWKWQLLPGGTLVRDSKPPERGHLAVTPETSRVPLKDINRGDLYLH
jgi:hypothetical protein